MTRLGRISDSRLLILLRKISNKFDLNNLFRAEFSSLSSDDIKEAFVRIKKRPNERIAEGVYVHEEIDLRVGYAFSLLNNMKLRRIISYSADTEALINYGPCQFPTFWFCFERVIERRKLKPKQYWTLVIKIKHGSQILELKSESGKVKSKAKAKEIFESIKNK